MYQMYHMFNKKRQDFNQCSNLRFLAPRNLWNLLQHRTPFGRYSGTRSEDFQCLQALLFRCAFGRAYPWPRECQNGKNEIEKIGCEIYRFSLHYSWKMQKPKTTEKIKSSSLSRSILAFRCLCPIRTSGQLYQRPRGIWNLELMVQFEFKMPHGWKYK